MHIHVLGLGPIGCLLSHHLRRVLPVQHTITLIHKTSQERSQMLKRGTICLERKEVPHFAEGFDHEVSVKGLETMAKAAAGSPVLAEVAKHSAPIDSLFVALKAQHTADALKALAPRLTSNSTIVLFQNGMGIYEQLVSQIFRNPAQRPHFIIASNTHGAYVKYPYHIIHAGLGSIEFGIPPDVQNRDYEASLYAERLDPSERRLRISDISGPGDVNADRYRTLRETVAALLLMQDLNVSWKSLSELHIIMQKKLVVNAAINPLSALYGCRNGDLFKVSFARDLLLQICQEASAVFAAKLYHDHQVELRRLRKEGIDTKGFEVPALPAALSPTALEKQVLRVVDLTSGNVSSMLQDVRCGRRTEVEFINGYIDDLGAEYGVPTPVNATLRNLVKLKYFIPMDQFV
ncbi:hypothetical protein HYPSUDRAFT_129563 [Hypholoma sublateritium FD-334 SS-4]|uniref:2-dehydropantoate 2-reductase n=1 Tax=Hypholoma sublateritium (strain FD-334 SS-4) TaxID=945553 RepID=A0A0D2PCC7_HYPSF|nr:hypothetical protein HYPSUDRAFT_129563 [Hypholoma sublateritium FD-334 SS-4]